VDGEAVVTRLVAGSYEVEPNLAALRHSPHRRRRLGPQECVWISLGIEDRAERLGAIVEALLALIFLLPLSGRHVRRVRQWEAEVAAFALQEEPQAVLHEQDHMLLLT
jgi:hypothetical protein